MRQESIYSEEIQKNVCEFAKEWSNMRRTLRNGGFFSSTMETYQAASSIIKGNEKNLQSLISTRKVDSLSLNSMVKLLNEGTLNIVSLKYPTLDGFNIFYYKRGDKALDKKVNEELRFLSGSDDRQSITDTISLLETIKRTTQSQDMYDAVDTEINFMGSLDVFTKRCEHSSAEIKRIMTCCLNAIETDLIQKQKEMLASSYFLYEKRRVQQMSELMHKTEVNIRLMTNLCEN